MGAESRERNVESIGKGQTGTIDRGEWLASPARAPDLKRAGFFVGIGILTRIDIGT